MALKKTSPLFNVGGAIGETAPAAFTQAEVNLPLTTLDREVFVVTDIQMHTDMPDAPAPGAFSNVFAQVTKTSQTGIVAINNPVVIGRQSNEAEQNAAGGIVQNMRSEPSHASTGSNRDHLAIIATPDFFIGIAGNGNAATKDVAIRLTGYRAKASADVYAALVTEELNQ